LADKRVRLLYAQYRSACAVTENGEVYTWGHGPPPSSFHLGHGVGSAQETPKRVEAARNVKVAAAAISGTGTLVAGACGAVWAFGDSKIGGSMRQLIAPIPNLRVRTLK